jgi:carbon-monoxide dehydrogenase medium subunit
MTAYDYHQPRSLEEAFRLVKSIPESLYISGGTDLMVRIKKKELHPRSLISLRSISGLSGIEKGKMIRLGAMTSINGLLKNPLLCDNFPVLIDAAKELGSAQIRNVATLGGNLCNGSPAADMAPPLLVCEAIARIQSSEKSRELPLEKFFLGPGETSLSHGEILTEILLEPPGPNTKSIFLKKGRTRMDLAVASVAALIRTKDRRCVKARIAVGSVAPTPLRLFGVEALLEEAAPSRELLIEARRLATESVSPISDVRSTADYRRHLVGVLVKRALEKLLNKESEEKFGEKC